MSVCWCICAQDVQCTHFVHPSTLYIVLGNSTHTSGSCTNGGKLLTCFPNSSMCSYNIIAWVYHNSCYRRHTQVHFQLTKLFLLVYDLVQADISGLVGNAVAW